MGTSGGRRWRVPLLALCAVLAAVGGLLLSRGGGGDGARGGAVERALEQVLERRAEAVAGRDEAAFLRDVAPGAFRTEQRRWFRNLAQVPLASWEYRLDAVHGDVADVELRYRLEGYDGEPLSAAERFTFTGRGGGVRLAGDAGGAAQLWDFGPVRVVRGAHSLVLGLGERDALRPYAREADRAVPAVRDVWGGQDWNGTVVLLVPASLRQMASLLGGSESAYAGIAAVTTAELRGSGAAPADRVIVNPEAFGGLSAFGRQAVLTHETVHVATRRATTGRTPLWLSEGFADWVAYASSGRAPERLAPELARDVRAGRAPRGLPADADFAPGADGLPQTYEEAWLACRMAAGEYGQDRLVELYRAVGRGGGVDRRMRDVLGTGLEDFTARWRAYVERQLGGEGR